MSMPSLQAMIAANLMGAGPDDTDPGGTSDRTFSAPPRGSARVPVTPPAVAVKVPIYENVPDPWKTSIDPVGPGFNRPGEDNPRWHEGTPAYAAQQQQFVNRGQMPGKPTTRAQAMAALPGSDLEGALKSYYANPNDFVGERVMTPAGPGTSLIRTLHGGTPGFTATYNQQQLADQRRRGLDLVTGPGSGFAWDPQNVGALNQARALQFNQRLAAQAAGGELAAARTANELAKAGLANAKSALAPEMMELKKAEAYSQLPTELRSDPEYLRKANMPEIIPQGMDYKASGKAGFSKEARTKRFPDETKFEQKNVELGIDPEASGPHQYYSRATQAANRFLDRRYEEASKGVKAFGGQNAIGALINKLFRTGVKSPVNKGLLVDGKPY